jgi:uncharacterized membrane protein
MNTTRTRPWALLFLISLAVNLFLAGLIAGRWLHRGKPGEGMARVVPAEAQPVARRVMASHRAAMGERGREAREARKRAVEALSAEPFDAAHATAALKEFRSKAAMVDEEMNAAMVELAGALPPSQRAQAARNLERGGGPRFRRQQ